MRKLEKNDAVIAATLAILIGGMWVSSKPDICADLLAVFLPIGLLALYFLPTTMSTHNRLAMFVANLFFGWTLIGWLILFAIAMRRPTVVVVNR